MWSHLDLGPNLWEIYLSHLNPYCSAVQYSAVQHSNTASTAQCSAVQYMTPFCARTKYLQSDTGEGVSCPPSGSAAERQLLGKLILLWGFKTGTIKVCNQALKWLELQMETVTNTDTENSIPWMAFIQPSFIFRVTSNWHRLTPCSELCGATRL